VPDELTPAAVPPPAGRSDTRTTAVVLGLVLALIAAVVWWSADRPDGDLGTGSGLGPQVGTFLQDEALPRDLQPYAGLGTWVDVFDYAPAYAGEEPAVTPADLDDMAAAGVRTVYLQAVRQDERSPDRIVDERLIARFLIEGHRAGLRMVGWYLPKLGDLQVDIDHVVTLADFEVGGGHRFDGVALDIEDTETEPDVAQRNERLVDLSEAAEEHLDGAALGAIVLPPVLLEEVNPDFWPQFPWEDLAGSYDVWLPMSYWTQRRADSGYQDGYTYNEESTRRVRANLGDEHAVVHGIGGIGDEVSAASLAAFGLSLADTGAVGGSTYDWSTLSAENRAAQQMVFTDGTAADLPAPPDLDG
jgi:hypothetical protein